MKNWQDSFQKEQDSIYKLNVQTRRDLPNKKISKKYQKDEKKQAIILLSVVTLIVILSASVILKSHERAAVSHGLETTVLSDLQAERVR